MIKHEDILIRRKPDRRVLPNIPDDTGARSNRVGGRTLASYSLAPAVCEAKLPCTAVRNKDRRLTPGRHRFQDIYNPGERYIMECDVNIRIYSRAECPAHAGKSYKLARLRCGDISASGMLLECSGGPVYESIKNADYLRLDFTPVPGALPEGFEHRIKIKAKIAREAGGVGFGVKFEKPLTQYLYISHGLRMKVLSFVMLLVIFAIITLMRAGSILYYRFNSILYLYSIITAAFLLSRFIIAAFTRPYPVNPQFTPSVSVIIPCFNEDQWIGRTIISCMNQEYPANKLEVIAVDDRSADNSVEVIKQTIKQIQSCHGASDRVRLIELPKNGGKREALMAGALAAKHDLLVFVDSDSFLEPNAIVNLVQPFQDPKTGGVAGRTNVANAYTNWLTKMQATRYYIAFRVMKAAESCFDTVSCLSGPLACYRKEIVLKNKDAWLNQKFFGRKATFGDDRALTNLVLRNHRTRYQDSAICSTIVPNNQKTFLKQQMRWKRSWLRESINALLYIWKKEPFAGLFFLMGLLIPVFAPVIVIYNLILVPARYGIFPATFLFGLALMSMLISFAYLFLKRSKLWVSSFLFCIYYELILLWQMPIAWITFWKSTWGTRLTPEDEKAMEKKHKRKLINIMARGGRKRHAIS